MTLARLSGFFEKITVDGYGEIQVIVRVRRGGAVSGRVSYADGTPAVGVEAEIFREGSDGRDETFVSVNSVPTDDRGYYRFTELPPGRYFVSIAEPAVHKGESREDDYAERFNAGRFTYGSELRIFFPASPSFKKAQGIEIDWGRESSETDVTIPNRHLFKLAGVIVAKKTQKPVKGISVTFRRLTEDGEPDADRNSTNRMVSDEKGTWSFKDLPQGKYRLEISSCLAYFCDQESTKDETMYAQAVKELELKDSDLKDFKIELEPEAVVSGTVTVDGKKAIPSGLRIYLVDQKSYVESSTGYYPKRSDDKSEEKTTEWNFRVGLLGEGRYLLAVRAGDNIYLKSITSGSSDITHSPLEIKEEQKLDGVKIVLSSDTGRLNGKVLGIDNKPVAAIGVLLLPVAKDRQEGYNGYFSGMSAANGEFLITAAPGEYYLTFPGPDDSHIKQGWVEKLTQNAEKVTIKSGETTSQSFTLSKR